MSNINKCKEPLLNREAAHGIRGMIVQANGWGKSRRVSKARDKTGTTRTPQGKKRQVAPLTDGKDGKDGKGDRLDSRRQQTTVDRPNYQPAKGRKKVRYSSTRAFTGASRAHQNIENRTEAHAHLVY